MAALLVPVVGFAGTVAVARYAWRRWTNGDEAATPAAATQPQPMKKLPDQASSTEPTSFRVGIVARDDDLLPATLYIGITGLLLELDEDLGDVTFPMTRITSWRTLKPEGFTFSFWPDDVDYDATTGNLPTGTTSLQLRTPDGPAIAAACKRAANAVVIEMARKDAAALSTAKPPPARRGAAAPTAAAAPVATTPAADLLLANAAKKRAAGKRPMASARPAPVSTGLSVTGTGPPPADAEPNQPAEAAPVAKLKGSSSNSNFMRLPPNLDSPQSTNESLWGKNDSP